MKKMNAVVTVAFATTIAMAAGLVSSAAAQSFQVIVLKGDPVPDGNGTFSAFTPPALNDEGQVAFAAKPANQATFGGFCLANITFSCILS